MAEQEKKKKREETKKEIDELERKYNDIMNEIKNKKNAQAAKKVDGTKPTDTEYSYYSESEQPTERNKP